jgi:hypothetical protein
MTTTTISPLSRSGGAEFERIWRVVRLHFTDRWSAFALPWMIFAVIFLANVGFWWIAASAHQGDQTQAGESVRYSGGAAYIFVYMLVVAIQTINNTFPFALGFGVTRRDFYLGTALTFAIYAVLYAAALTVLSYLEQWTGGWGLGGRMFTIAYIDDGPVWQRFFVLFVVLLIFIITGMSFATVYVRWRATGLTLAFGAITLALFGVIALLTTTGSWPAVGNWFDATGVTGVLAWLLIPTAVVALAGFFILRRATPKN